MECVLSIVDHGSDLEVLVSTTRGVVVGRALLPGSSNPRFIEEHGLRRRLERAITEASQGLDDAICLSATAAVPADPGKLRQIVADIVPIDPEAVLLTSAARCGVAGSLGTVFPERVIVVHADVGSYGWGIAVSGRESTTGAFGEALGDDGSAFWIGRKGIRAALRSAEKRARNTILKTSLLSHFGKQSHLDLLRAEWEEPALDRYAMASFAPAVFEAARKEDSAAVEILEEAGRELSVMALVLINELDLIDGAFTVLPTGSVFRARGMCLETFVKALRNKTAKSSLVREGAGAAVGGALLAIHHLGLRVRPELFESLQTSAETVARQD